MTEPVDDERLGDLVLRENFLSEEELTICMEARKETSPPRSLQEVMLEKDFLTPSQMKRILKKYFSGDSPSESSIDRFGEVAIRKGFITEEQLQECLQAQRSGREAGRNLRLGQLLMQRRLISTQQFLEVLKAQESYSVSCPECGQVSFSGEVESSDGEGFRCSSCQSLLENKEEPLPFPPTEVRVESDVDTLQSTAVSVSKGDSRSGDSSEGDRYRLIQQLGQNARTVVHQAYDRSRGEVVLLKMVRRDMSETPFAERLLQEARKRKESPHSAYLPVFDVGIRDGCAYFTMEFQEGRSLDRRIREMESSPLDVARTMERIALALDSLHEQGMSHGNIKASNIFFSRDEDILFSDSGVPEGLSDYMPPEKIGKQVADIRGDIYSLGIVLYQMLTGKLPFETVPREMLQKAILDRVPRSPRETNENLPVDLEAICLRAVEKDPLMRYGSVRDFVGDLRRFLEGVPVRSRPGSTVARMVWGVRRFRRRMIVASVLVTLGAFLGYHFFVENVADFSGGADSSLEDLRSEAEPYFLQARELSGKAGQVTFSLQTLYQSFLNEAVRLDDAAQHCTGSLRDCVLSVSDQYRKASRLIRSGAIEKASIRDILSVVGGAIAEERRDSGALSSSGKVHLNSLEEGERKLRRQWERVGFWPGEGKKSFLSSLEMVEKAISIDSSYGEAYLLKGRILHQLWRLGEAMEAFERAQALSEKNPLPEVHFEYGALLFTQWALAQGKPLVLIDSRGHSLSLLPMEKSVSAMALHLRKYLGQEGRLPRENRYLAQSMLEIIGEKTSGPNRIHSGIPEVIFGEKSSSPGVYRILGFLYQVRNEIRRSYESFTRAIQVDWMFSREGIESRSLYPRPALEYLRSYLGRQEMGTSVLACNRAFVQLAFGEESSAKSSLDELLKNDPDFVLAQIALLRIKLKQASLPQEGKDPVGKRVRALREEALSFCDQALQKSPEDPHLQTFRVENLTALGRGKEALESVQVLLKNQVGNPYLHYLEACSYLSLGSSDRAMRSAKSALQSVSDFALAYEIRARARLGVRDFLGAMEDVNQALTLQPGLVSALLTRARIQAFQPKKDIRSALKSLSEAEELAPENPDVLFWKGEILAHQLHKKMSQEREHQILSEALFCYERAIWADPGYANAHVMRAVNRIRLKKTNSLAELSSVAAKFPTCGLAFFFQGQLLYSMKKYEEAIESWEIARALLPSHRALIREGLRLARSRIKAENVVPEWLKKIQHTHKHVNDGDYDKARTEFDEIVPLLPEKVPQNKEQVRWLVLFSYNYACVLSVYADKTGKGEREPLQKKALYWLEVANRLGWYSWKDQCHSSGNEHMMYDEDLKGLRDLPRFKKLLMYSKE